MLVLNTADMLCACVGSGVSNLSLLLYKDASGGLYRTNSVISILFSVLGFLYVVFLV